MYKSGHTGTSLLLYSPLLAAFVAYDKPILGAIGLMVILTCSSLPDLDFKAPVIKHRGYSHSLIGAALISLPIGGVVFIAYKYLNLMSSSIGVSAPHSPAFIGIYGVGIGFFAILTHYAGDIVTPSGIPILAPVSKKYYSLNWWYAKNPLANGLAFALGIGSTIFALFHQSILPMLF